jgi:hypothetical protein
VLVVKRGHMLPSSTSFLFLLPVLKSKVMLEFEDVVGDIDWQKIVEYNFTKNL